MTIRALCVAESVKTLVTTPLSRFAGGEPICSTHNAMGGIVLAGPA